MHQKSRTGFTLIELLVVIAIVGLLASVVLQQLNVARRKARDTGRTSAVQQVIKALEIYRTDNGRYPGGNETEADFLSLMPGYIRSLSAPTGDVVQYQGLNSTSGGACALGGNCQSYHIGIRIEDVSDSVATMLSDKDSEGLPGDTIDGLSTAAACGADAGATPATDLCYDLLP